MGVPENNGVEDELIPAPKTSTSVESHHEPGLDEPPAPPVRPRRRPEDRTETQVLIAPPSQTGYASTDASGVSHKQDGIEDDGQERNGGSRNNTGSSPEAAHWDISLADSMSTQGEVGSLFTAPKAPSAASSATTEGSYLPALQDMTLAGHDGLKPLVVDEADTTSFDLVLPAEESETNNAEYSIEARSELLFSVEHLKVIFDDPVYLQKFTNFLYTRRPASVPLLKYYMNSMKALKAIGYANALTRELAAIARIPSTRLSVPEATNKSLVSRANEAFEMLAREELPAYVSHVWAWFASMTMKQRITNTLPPDLRDFSEGSVDVFCLTDPSRHDHPIVFASEDFHKASQYGRRFAIGRNCRFLQGPKTNRHSVQRLREMLAAGKEHCETLLNYRRDGSVFMNLLTVVPLYDNRGNIRYHLGTQVDISGLVKECAGLRSLEDLVVQNTQMMSSEDAADELDEHKGRRSSKEVLGRLAKTFTPNELKIIQAPGGNPRGSGSHFEHTSNSTSLSRQNNDTNNRRQQHQQQQQSAAEEEVKTKLTRANTTINSNNNNNTNSSSPSPSAPSVPTSASISVSSSSHGKTIPRSARIQGILEHYLLVRPFPSLRILFASPSLRVPGILQSSLLSRIGGSTSDREVIAEEFRAGRGVTAKIRWLARPVANFDCNPNSHSRNTYTPSHTQSHHSRNTNNSNNSRTRAPSHRSTTANNTPPDPGLKGRSRWIHTTPLLGVNGAVGVWMVILVDDETADWENEREKGKAVVPPVQPSSTLTMRGRTKEKEKEKWSRPRMPFDGTEDITTSEEDGTASNASNSLASRSHNNPDPIPELSGGEAEAEAEAGAGDVEEMTPPTRPAPKPDLEGHAQG